MSDRRDARSTVMVKLDPQHGSTARCQCPGAPVLSVARADGTRPDGGTVALPTRSSWVAQGRTSRRRCCCLIFVELTQRHRRGRSAMTTASARFTAARIEKQPGWRSASSLAPHRALSAKWHGASSVRRRSLSLAPTGRRIPCRGRSQSPRCAKLGTDRRCAWADRAPAISC